MASPNSGYLELAEVLGEKYEKRFVSAEKLVSDFRSRRVASEIAAYAEACEISYQITEKALSNEIITPWHYYPRRCSLVDERTTFQTQPGIILRYALRLHHWCAWYRSHFF